MWKFSVSKSKIIKLDRMLHFLGNWVIQFAKYHSLEKFFNKINLCTKDYQKVCSVIITKD